MKKLFTLFGIAPCNSRKIFFILLPLLLVGFMNVGWGQVTLTSTTTTYTQDFNTLANTGTGNVWTDNTTITGWYSNRTVYIGDDGSNTTGGLHSYGTTSNSERSLGGLSSGSAIPSYGVRIVNNTGSSISSFDVSYKGEQWRQNTSSQTLVFEYQVGATSISSGTWTPITALDFTSIKTGTAGAINGNAAGNFSNKSATITVLVSNGQEIWFRWTKSGTNSHGLAIDDFSVSATIGSLLTPPTLTAAPSATVDGPFDITFSENASWRTAISSITVDGTTLDPAGYNKTVSGKITFTPSASNPANLLQTSGSNKTITVIASGYSSAVVCQTINPGASTKLGIKTQPTSPSTNGGLLTVQPEIYIQDQYGNRTTSTASVVASVGTGSWTIGGVTTIAGVSGTASFTDLTATSLSSVTGATINFSSGTLTGINSIAFNIPAPIIDYYISLTSTPYTQDFNTLVNTGTSSTLPEGWYFSESGSSANGLFTAHTGSTNSGDTYSYGLDASTERCLGGLQSGSLNPTYGAKIKNNTGAELNAIKISYIGETWRVGAADRPDRIDFQYSTDATSLTTGTWIDADNLDYQNPGQATGSGTLQHSSNIIGKITGLTLANGSNIWIRWVDYNASGADDGMGIDDISISPLASFPTTQSTNVSLNYVNSTTYNISWTKGNGNSSIVFVKFISSGTAVPEDGVSYKANSTIGSGDQIGSTGWYCVYNGPGLIDGNVNITGFSVGQPLTAMVCEYNGRGTLINYNATTNASNPTSGVLPITLSNLNYVVDKNQITLNWTTETEHNNSGFDIERKTVSGSWDKIGFVKGKGNSTDAVNYSFEDNKLNTGKYEYRIKQIDFNGNFEYFKLNGFVEIGIPDKYNLSQNYPNPFNPTTKIDYELPFDSRVSILVYDMLGRQVKALVSGENKQAGFYTVELNSSSLSSGIYFYRMFANGQGKDVIFTKKMLLIK